MLDFKNKLVIINQLPVEMPQQDDGVSINDPDNLLIKKSKLYSATKMVECSDCTNLPQKDYIHLNENAPEDAKRFIYEAMKNNPRLGTIKGVKHYIDVIGNPTNFVPSYRLKYNLRQKV